MGSASATQDNANNHDNSTRLIQVAVTSQCRKHNKILRKESGKNIYQNIKRKGEESKRKKIAQKVEQSDRNLQTISPRNGNK